MGRFGNLSLSKPPADADTDQSLGTDASRERKGMQGSTLEGTHADVGIRRSWKGG